MPTIHIEHPCYRADGSLVADGWRVTCAYPDGSHCDIDEYDDDGEFEQVISETLLEGDYSEEYIREHYRPHIEIGDDTNVENA